MGWLDRADLLCFLIPTYMPLMRVMMMFMFTAVARLAGCWPRAVPSLMSVGVLSRGQASLRGLECDRKYLSYHVPSSLELCEKEGRSETDGQVASFAHYLKAESHVCADWKHSCLVSEVLAVILTASLAGSGRRSELIHPPSDVYCGTML